MTELPAGELQILILIAARFVTAVADQKSGGIGVFESAAESVFSLPFGRLF